MGARSLFCAAEHIDNVKSGGEGERGREKRREKVGEMAEHSPNNYRLKEVRLPKYYIVLANITC
jgi:hypothetical protein